MIIWVLGGSHVGDSHTAYHRLKSLTQMKLMLIFNLPNSCAYVYYICLFGVLVLNLNKSVGFYISCCEDTKVVTPSLK